MRFYFIAGLKTPGTGKFKNAHRQWRLKRLCRKVWLLETDASLRFCADMQAEAGFIGHVLEFVFKHRDNWLQSLSLCCWGYGLIVGRDLNIGKQPEVCLVFVSRYQLVIMRGQGSRSSFAGKCDFWRLMPVCGFTRICRPKRSLIGYLNVSAKIHGQSVAACVNL